MRRLCIRIQDGLCRQVLVRNNADMDRLKTIFFCLAACLMISCHDGDNPEVVDPSGESWRLTVNGKPFMMLGAQLRTDYFIQLDGRKLDELDDYFSLAAGMNITCIQVPIAWGDIETAYDVYSDDYVRAYIDYCEKYGMKLEILWYGSYMCGYSVEGYLPAYVVDDNTTYPELKASAAYNGWLGKQFYLRPGNTALVTREKKAIAKMMDYVYDYDKSLGSPHTVIGVQIENEPDMLATRHNGSHGYSANDIWPSLLYHLDQLGQAVKASPYECYTRVNQTTTYDDWVYWSKMVQKREGIDYVGFDPYVKDVQTIEEWLGDLRDISGNFSHVAENGGEYYNNDILSLKALVMGCGYEVFEVITSPHPYLTDWTLRGVYNTDFTPKPQTQRLLEANALFKSAWYDFATADVGNMYGFNLENSDGDTEREESGSTKSVSFRWKTASRGVAFAIEGDGYLLVGSTKNDEFYPSFTPGLITSGKYDSKGDWINDGASASYENGKLSMKAGSVYKIVIN